MTYTFVVFKGGLKEVSLMSKYEFYSNPANFIVDVLKMDSFDTLTYLRCANKLFSNMNLILLVLKPILVCKKQNSIFPTEFKFY